MLDILPTEVVHELQDHLRSGCAHAEDGWEGGQADEDALTGDLGASLRTKWQSVATGDGSAWRWRLKYTKFRGKGTGAEEKAIGADGIFQIEMEDTSSGEMHNKGLLFQAKKHNDRHKKKLFEQATAMGELAENASAIFEYGPRMYRGFDASHVDENFGSTKRNGAGSRLGDYLADDFLPCKVGLRGLYYESARRTLFIPKAPKGFRRIRTRLKHGFRIEVQRRA
jgi:hypothetical protein